MHLTIAFLNIQFFKLYEDLEKSTIHVHAHISPTRLNGRHFTMGRQGDFPEVI